MKLTFHSTIQQVWGNGEAAIVTAPSTLALYCMKVLRSWFEQQIQRDDDKVQEAQRQSATLAIPSPEIKAVEEEIRLVNEKITAVEEEIRLAKASNDKEEVQDLRRKEEQLRRKEEQLRKEKEILLMREVGPS